MFKKLFTILVLLVSFISQAQQRFGNEWINNSQSYYKIILHKDGIYRINYSALQQAGVPIATIDPKYFQLYHFGKEQAIYIAGEADGQFNTGDFIEFFGAHNDGRSDSLLFKSGEQANPYYSFVSDTTAYFLTWNSTQTMVLSSPNLIFCSIVSTMAPMIISSTMMVITMGTPLT